MEGAVKGPMDAVIRGRRVSRAEVVGQKKKGKMERGKERKSERGKRGQSDVLSRVRMKSVCDHRRDVVAIRNP
jgi:hypothetical protein